MAVTYTKIYQGTELPVVGATGSFSISNPLPAGMVESLIFQIRGTSGAGGVSANSLSSLISSLRCTFNGNQFFNFASLADVSASQQVNRLSALVQDIGGFVAENISATAQDMMIEIPVGISLGNNSRFEIALNYFALGAGLALAGNLEIWCKYGASTSSTITGNATSFPVPVATQTMMTVAVPNYGKGAKVAGVVLQGTANADNLASVVVQPLGNFSMTPTYLRGSSFGGTNGGNGYSFAALAADANGLVGTNFCTGQYFIALYDLDVSSGSINLLVTTVAGAALETYTATPILKLPNGGGKGEKIGVQTATVATSASGSILRRAEE